MKMYLVAVETNSLEGAHAFILLANDGHEAEADARYILLTSWPGLRIHNMTCELIQRDQVVRWLAEMEA